MRDEAINQFTKGLMMDAADINTSNEVLTDCVNGTLITYNGNEYALQNDMGNYKLKYSKLPNNYMPVGTTEYGDILYIVAYNPLTKKVQIGSFPSPQRMNESTDPMNEDIVSILTQINGEGEYTEAMKFQKLHVYYDGTDTYKIYPGDAYTLDNIPTSPYIYEKLHYYILDDNKKLHDITDEVKADGKEHYVSWQVPGYLAAQWVLPEITSFNVRPRSIIPVENGVKANINFQIESSDELVQTAHERNNLLVTVNDEINAYTDDVDKYGDFTYYNTQFDGASDDNTPILLPVEEDNTLLLKAVPKIETKLNKFLTYDQFLTTLRVDLNTIFSADNVFIANNRYTYTVTGSTATVNFDIDAPIVTAGEVNLQVFAVPYVDFINAGYNVDNLDFVEVTKGNSYDGVGQQIIELNFEQPENIYLLKIAINDDNNKIVKYKVLILSELMNDFNATDYPLYDKIPMNIWSRRLSEIETTDVSFDWKGDATCEGTYSESVLDTNFWGAAAKEATGFVPEDSYSLTAVDDFKRGYTYSLQDCLLSGKIQQKFLYNFCSIKFSDESVLTLDDLTFSVNDVFNTNFVIDIDKLNVNLYVEDTYELGEQLAANTADDSGLVDLASMMKYNGIDCDHWIEIIITAVGKNNNEQSNYILSINGATYTKDGWRISTIYSTNTPYKCAQCDSAAVAQTIISSNEITTEIRKFFAKWNTCFAYCVLRTIHTNEANHIGFLTETAFDGLELSLNNAGECNTFGVITLQSEGPLFLSAFNKHNLITKPTICTETYYVNTFFDVIEDEPSTDPVDTPENPIRPNPNANVETIIIDGDIECPRTHLRTLYTNTAIGDLKYMDIMHSFATMFKVNTLKQKELQKGIFLQKAEADLKEVLIPSVNGSITGTTTGIEVLNSANKLYCSLDDIVLDNFSGTIATSTLDNYTFVFEDEEKQIIKEFDKTAWPYVGDGDTIDACGITRIEDLCFTYNAYIREQYDRCLASPILERVFNGTTVGYYLKDNEYTDDWKLIEDTLNNSIKDSYYGSNSVPIYKLYANSGDTTNMYWAVATKHDTKNSLLRTDEGDNDGNTTNLWSNSSYKRNHPRQKLFWCNEGLNFPYYESDAAIYKGITSIETVDYPSITGTAIDKSQPTIVNTNNVIENNGSSWSITTNPINSSTDKVENGTNVDVSKEDTFDTTITIGTGTDIGKINGKYSPTGKPILYVLELNDYSAYEWYNDNTLKTDAFKPTTQRTYHYAIQLPESDAAKLRAGTLTYKWEPRFACDESLTITSATTAYQNFKDTRYISFFPGVTYRTPTGQVQAIFDYTYLMKYTGNVVVGKGADYGKINGAYATDGPIMWNLDTGKPLDNTATITTPLGSIVHLAVQLPENFDGNKLWHSINVIGYNALEWRGWLENENSTANSIIVNDKYSTNRGGVAFSEYNNARYVYFTIGTPEIAEEDIIYPTAIALDHDDVTMYVGDTLILTAQLTPSNANTPVTWSLPVGMSSYLTLTRSGNKCYIKAVKPISTQVNAGVTFADGDRRTTSCFITVKDKNSGEQTVTTNNNVTIENTYVDIAEYLNTDKVLTMKYGEVYGWMSSLKESGFSYSGYFVDNDYVIYNENYGSYIQAIAPGEITLTILHNGDGANGAWKDRKDTVLGTIKVKVLENPDFVELKGVETYLNGELVSGNIKLKPNATNHIYAYTVPRNATAQYITWDASIGADTTRFKKSTFNHNHCYITTGDVSEYSYRYYTVHASAEMSSSHVSKSKTLVTWVKD